ncbi:uncharacterized protein sas isoform X8 [Panulirus ornatus]|uniref:uncharacterized protein sas isoform X8 n=1 Tax=Panulirus ornatus TaxID=150431 RepID=UPI003A855D61
MLVTRAVLVAALAPYLLVWAQLGGLQENSTAGGDSCQCTPACEGGVGVGGCSGREVERADCPCCRVCAQEEGKPCSEPYLPCDTKYGLVCSSERVCKAEYPCTLDGDCPGDRFCLGVVCVDPCPILTPCRGTLKGGKCVSKDHRPVCECPAGTLPDSLGQVCVPYNASVAGCEYGGRLYAEGEVRYEGECQQQCRCGSDGAFTCGPVTCPPGLFLAGQHANQELCIELRNRPEADECCVAVACANSLAQPSLLTSPVLADSTHLTQEEHVSSDQYLTALQGRHVGQGHAPPISEEEYQRRLKDLEGELAKKNEKKKIEGKLSEKWELESSRSTSTAAATAAAAEEALGVAHTTTESTGVPQLEISTFAPPEADDLDQQAMGEVLTTLMPMLLEKEHQLTTEEQEAMDEEAAVVVEYDEQGQQVHRITVHHQVDVVTEMTGGALDDEVGVATDATPALEQEEDLATDITPALQQQGDLVTDITPALQQQEDLVTDISPSLQQEEDLATDITPALQQEEKDLVTDITPALQQEEDLATDIPPALQQQEDLFTDISPSLQQEEDLVTDISPLLQQEEDLATDITPALQQEEEDLVTDIPPALQQEEEDLTQSLTREGKMASEENITHPAQLIPEEFPKAESKVGAGALKVREVSHNSSTIVLPSSKGGEVYYKAAESTEWLREIVPAGEESLVLRGLRPSTQYTLKWSSASGGGSAKITIDTEEGCRVHNMSYATGHEWSEGCQQRCSCRPAGAVDCQPRCLFVAGDITDPLCTERPAPEDPECCVVYDCKSVNVTNFQSSTATDIVGLPKLLVTEKTHSSVTLAWDDFRARTYEGGYVAEYREKHSDAAAEAMPEQLWMRKEVPTEELPPRLTVEGLKPNTVYEVRVSIYDDVEEGRLGEATETISVRTEAGCVHGNSSHAVGEFYNGCEETCMCVATGDVRCFERCTLPYFRAGSFKGDPMCSEQPNENDECCVVVLCARDPVAFSQCTNVVCGPNAECISGAVAPKDLSDIDSDLTLGYCHCLQGFTGDASDLVHGCTPDPSAGRKEGSCTFKNSTYRPGDVFYDECDYRCACNNNTEIECEPRCEFPHEDGSETEPGCEYLPDPEDSCCKLRVCNSTSEAATDAARAPSLPSDGCTEGNITYARDEKFYKGCENQCICMGFGDISCYPRCPPLKVVSETPKRCETLPDPQDSCCSITVCDEETPDVMKANITELKDEMKNMTEMEKKMMMREMMMNMTESEKEMMMNMTESEKEMMMKEMISMGGTEKEMDMTEIEEPARNMTALAVEERTSEVDTEMEEEEILSTVMPDGEMLVHTHSPENMNEGHTHKHTHRDGTHTHNDTAEDGQVVDHAHARDMSDWQIQNHDIFNGTHNHTHSHENGIIHTHPHHHNMDNSHDHEHDMDMLHTQAHAHKDGENEWQIQNHDTLSGTHNHTHTHENGITHIHPHLHNNNNAHEHDVDELRSPEHMHSHDHGMDDTHTHEHTHREGTDLTHPHEQDVTQDHTNDTHIHMHTHKDGTTLNHPHDHSVDETQEQEHPQEEIHNHTHMHKDGVIHTHPHDHEMDDHNHTHSSGMDHTHTIDGMDNFQNQTHLNVLEKKNRAEDLGTHDLNILEVIALNATTVVIRLAVSELVMNKIISPDNQQILVLYSPDSLTWSERNISTSDVIKENFNEIALFLNDLQPSTPYQFRVVFQDFVSSTSKATLMDGTINADGVDGVDVDTSMKCSHKGRYYKPGQEFYEECSHSCICTESLEVHCAAIECPVTFGLELIDPNCLEWDLDPDYVPTPPKCCPQVKCISSSACQYVGQTFDNYEQIPREITGCSQVCTCNYGNVTCRDLCEPVPPSPPLDLSCDPKDAVLITLPGETCCRSWQCAAHSAAGTPAIFPLPPVSVLGGNPSSGFVSVSPSAPPNFGADVIAEPRVSSQDARTAHFFFSTPTLYQGLPGELFFRFTNDPVNHPDPSTWSKEVLVPMGSMISQSEWDHLLTGLDPSTTYTMQLVLTVQGAEPVTSPVFTYTTMEEATTPSTTTPLPHLDITADLYASEVTKTTAKVSWRVFDDFELQYIDGVLVKYTEKDKRIPKFSQMLHRDNNHVYLRDLQPGRSYTVDLDFVTHKNQTTQVSNTKNITFTTLPEEDPYAFDIEVTAGKVSSQTAELFYSGVPEPEEKYVNVYRVVYLREVERIDAQTFKIPKTGQERKIFLSDLKPDIEYQVWLEAYLSNGRKKKSNVLTITTRAGELPKPERSEVDPSAKDSEDGESYYSELVTVAIIAAIACLGFLGLLVILLRKQSHAKAHISSSRNTAAYDNPSYKVGDNTYDMEMNGIKGSGNGATHAEEP